MRYGGARLSSRQPRRTPHATVPLLRTYSAQPSSPPHTPSPPPPPPPPATQGKGGVEVMKERTMAALQRAGELGHQWGQRSWEAASSSVSSWWRRYEEFVGLNEVRGAQLKVTETEAGFMVARATVREAHSNLEAVQLRLKEIRDRLDRISREEESYLELATLEHRLLQEERRLRGVYESSERGERESFSLFSAGVRESHEKERSRAERTKNWSLIGSVLGALIGVLGSTYINRVRLQELRSLLQEAQKGPESLLEVLRVQEINYSSQHAELQTLIDRLRLSVAQPSSPAPQGDETPPPVQAPPTVPLLALEELVVGSRRAESLLEPLPPQLGRLQEGVARLEAELLVQRTLLETRPEALTPADTPTETADRAEPARGGASVGGVAPQEVLIGLEETRRTLGERIRTNTLYNAVMNATATAVTVSALYLLLRGAT